MKKECFNLLRVVVVSILYHYYFFNVYCQIGGNDQMGNISSGHELISRVRNNVRMLFGKHIQLQLQQPLVYSVNPGRENVMPNSEQNLPELVQSMNFVTFLLNITDNNLMIEML